MGYDADADTAFAVANEAPVGEEKTTASYYLHWWTPDFQTGRR
jgi:hypothetical protein